MKTQLRRMRGFSLVEILLVIGIIIALAIAAFVLYPRVQMSQQANQESSNLTAIAAQTKQVFSNGVYDGLTNDVALAARIFPTTMTQNLTAAGSPVRNVWKGAVTIADAAPTTAGTREFVITYNAVPAEACVRLATGVGNNFDQIRVGASGAAGVVVKPSLQPVDQALAALECEKQANNNTVTFVSN